MSDDDVVDLTERLRATDADPPPAELLAAARAAYSWRTLDTDLCRPAYDSLLDEALTPVRGELTARLLRFEAGDVTLDLEVNPEGDARTLVGQVTPPQATELTVRHGVSEETSVTSDGLGRFVVDDVRRGPMSVRVALASRSPLHTDWVLV